MKTDVSEVRNELETNSYGLLHLRGKYEWKQASVDFGIENLFDIQTIHWRRLYRSGQDHVRNRCSLGTPAGYGRLYAGVNYKF